MIRIFPGFGAKVMSIIRGQAPGHIVCSYLYLSNDYRQITGRPLIPADAPAASLRRLLPHYGWALGFIGANVFCRERFATCGVDGFGTYFHPHRSIDLLSPEPDELLLGFVAEPLVGNRADDETTATWSGDRLNVVFGLEKSFIAAMKGRYSQAEIDQSRRRSAGLPRFTRSLGGFFIGACSPNAPVQERNTGRP